MTSRFVVLFAREPGNEARRKGFGGREGADLFAAFAAGWVEAAAGAGAQLVVSAPPGDCAGWRRSLPRIELLEQRGRTFGDRLEDSARQAAQLGGIAVLVGGDVAPCLRTLREAFAALEGGADAALAPAPDGGVSLVALAEEDLKVLREIVPGRADVFAHLDRRLRERGRRIAVVAAAIDVDGRRELRSLVRFLPPALREVARLALSAVRVSFAPPRTLSLLPERTRPSGLRAPPAAA
jgi:glycosyltransferase A (GT-A) superfamily protein (DUF2064 family)